MEGIGPAGCRHVHVHGHEDVNDHAVIGTLEEGAVVMVRYLGRQANVLNSHSRCLAEDSANLDRCLGYRAHAEVCGYADPDQEHLQVSRIWTVGNLILAAARDEGKGFPSYLSTRSLA